MYQEICLYIRIPLILWCAQVYIRTALEDQCHTLTQILYPHCSEQCPHIMFVYNWGYCAILQSLDLRLRCHAIANLIKLRKLQTCKLFCYAVHSLPGLVDLTHIQVQSCHCRLIDVTLTGTASLHNVHHNHIAHSAQSPPTPVQLTSLCDSIGGHPWGIHV